MGKRLVLSDKCTDTNVIALENNQSPFGGKVSN